jgi:hypothetical protein
MGKKKANAKNYPIIKPPKPRTKNSAQTITMFFDPQGGHGDVAEAFELVFKATPEQQKKLKKYAMNEPESFLHDLQIQIIKPSKLIIKPPKPRTKNSAQTITILFDPRGSHGDVAEAFELAIKATPEQQQRLKEYLMNEPKGFLHDLQIQVAKMISDFEDEKHYGLHAKTHKFEAQIKNLAPRIYLLVEYWIKQEPKEWPGSFASRYKKLVDFNDGQLGEDLRDKNSGGFRADGITQAMIIASPFGKSAQDNRLKLYCDNPEHGAYILNVYGFRKSYIDTPCLKRLRKFFNKLQSDFVRAYMISFTERWLKYLINDKNHFFVLPSQTHRRKSIAQHTNL